MPIRRKTRLWTSIGAAALLAGGVSACGDGGEPTETATAPAEQAADTGAMDQAADTDLSTVDNTSYGAGEGEGEGGEGGGEFGIDPDAAAKDPIVFLTAVDAMRAHYYGAIAALNSGDRSAMADLLAHPISEIYIDFEPVLLEKGGPDMYDPMQNTARLQYDDASDDEIRAAIDNLMTMFDEAVTVAPDGDQSDAFVQSAVLTDLIERAALQYQLAANDPATADDAYLDGYGMYAAAKNRAETALPLAEAADADAAATMQAALSLLDQAYPDAMMPETLPIPAADALSASQAASDAAAKL